MRKRCNPHLSAPALAITDQKSNTHCSWSGGRPTASAPNASSLFCPRSSKRLLRHEHLQIMGQGCQQHRLRSAGMDASQPLLCFEQVLCTLAVVLLDPGA